jgi:hypothetical protein
MHVRRIPKGRPRQAIPPQEIYLGGTTGKHNLGAQNQRQHNSIQPHGSWDRGALKTGTDLHERLDRLRKHFGSKG